MATATSNQVFDNSTLANFQSWTSAIFNAFVTTCGWLQTGDTGQAANPIAAVPSSTYVYWIFKANDAQAAALPIYVKVELGFSATAVQIRMTVGTGSNGSGTITGGVVSGAPWLLSTFSTNQGAGTFPCFFSGDAGEFRMYMWSSTTTNVGVIFGIERSKDSSGAKTADYFTVLSSAANANAANQQCVLSSSLVGLKDLAFVNAAPSAGAGTGSFNGTVAAFPLFPVLGKIGNPMLGFMCAVEADVAEASSVTVASMYGGTHTYVAAIGGTATRSFGNCLKKAVNSTNMALLMRYE